MTEFLLIRHAVNDFVKTGRLAGWTSGVHLNDEGRLQAEALGKRLAETRLDALYASPLERCQETAQAVIAHHPALTLQTLDDIGEVRFGDWQGGELKQLVRRKRWPMVQAFPSRTQFPNGETVRAAQMRAIDALEKLAQLHPRERVAVVSHADIIKLVLTYYLGMPLDMFQRVNVSPASLSTVSVGHMFIMVGQINESSYLPKPVLSGKQIDAGLISTAQVYTIGAPGSRTFYLTVTPDQAASRTGAGNTVITFDFEKTQAAILSDLLGSALGEHQAEYQTEAESASESVPEPLIYDSLPPAIPVITFRAGKLEAVRVEGDQITLTVYELTGDSSAEAGKMSCTMTLQTAVQLAESARRAITGGRE